MRTDQTSIVQRITIGAIVLSITAFRDSFDVREGSVAGLTLDLLVLKSGRSVTTNNSTNAAS